jgi:hypothetical protein
MDKGRTERRTNSFNCGEEEKSSVVKRDEVFVVYDKEKRNQLLLRFFLQICLHAILYVTV